MRGSRATLFFLFILNGVAAQNMNTPWETVAPAGSMIYTDMKTATKEAAICYRLDLTNADFILDKKILPKVPKLSNVMALKLGNNNLTEIPSVFLSLTALNYFGSFGNPLTTLSDSIGMWSSLRYLEFSGTNFDTIPSGISGLTRLQSLAISKNKDTIFIPKDFSGLHNSLNELKIYNTVLDTLVPEFNQLDKLQKIVFYKCGLTYFPYHISHLASLKELWLDSNSITELPRHISTMQDLQLLSLRGNKIKHIPSTICFLTNLTVLDLRGNPIDPYEVQCLQALLPQCRILF